jgi:hypothetical protein
MSLFWLWMITKATTTCGVSPQEGIGQHNDFVATCAFTKPKRCTGFVFADVTQNSQAAEGLSGKVFSDGRGNGYNLISHICTSIAYVVRGLKGVATAFQSPLFYHVGVIF